MQERSSGRSILRIGALTLCVLLFTLAFYKITKTGWTSEGEFDVDVVKFTAGIPRWVTYTSVASTGSPPPLYGLPDGHQYHPGLRIDPGWLALAWLPCLAGVLCIATCVRWLRRRDLAVAPGRSCLLVGTLGIGIGAIVPTDPAWIGVALALGLLSTAIARVGWSSRRVANVALGSITAILGSWWAHRMVRPLRYDYTELHLIDNLKEGLVFFSAYLLVGCIAVYWSKTWRRGRDASRAGSS